MGIIFAVVTGLLSLGGAHRTYNRLYNGIPPKSRLDDFILSITKLIAVVLIITTTSLHAVNYNIHIGYQQAGYVPGAVGTYKPQSGTSSGYAPYGITPTVYPSTGGAYGNIVSGVLTLSTANVTLDSLDISARIVIAANNITLSKCRIRGGPAITSGSDHGLVENNSHFLNAIVQDCLLSPDNPTAWINGVRGDNITVQRCEIRGCCDGIDLFSNATGTNSNTFIYANLIWLLGGYDPDSIGRPFSHNDCIQVTDGINITIKGNNLQGFLDPAIGQASEQAPNYNSNSCIQLTQGTGIVTGILVDHNWADGGGASFNFIATGQSARNIGSVINNIFGHKQTFQGGSPGVDGTWGSGGDNTVAFLSQSGLTYTSVLGNVYEDDGHGIRLDLIS